MANRYWVGGTDTWNSTAGSKWSTTSGGGGGSAAPTSSDDVFFDAASGAAVVTLGSTRPCNNITCTGFTGTLALSTQTLQVSGNATFAAGMTLSGTAGFAAIDFLATATGKTITTAGLTIPAEITFNGTGGGWTLQDNLTTGAEDVILSRGTLNTNGFSVSCAIFNISASTTRVLTLGASVITCSTWTATTTTSLTFNVDTSTITCSGAFSGGGLTYNDVNLTAVISQTLSGANTFATLTRTHASGVGTLVLSGNQTVSTSLTITGLNDAANRALVLSSAYGTRRTITCNGSISLTNVDFRSITGAGSATWTGTSLGDATDNSGITFTSPVNRYWVHPATASQNITASNWSTTSGGSTGATYPLPQDTAYFDANSFPSSGKTITNSNNHIASNQVWTGVTNSPTRTFTAFAINGSITFAAGVTLSGAVAVTSNGANTITTAGLTIPFSLTIGALSGTFTFGDNYTSTGSLTHTSGTLNLNNNNVEVTTFTNSNTSTRTLTLGSGTLTLTGTGAVFDQSTTTGLTVTATTGTIKLTNSSASSKTFAGGGLTYGNFWNATGSSGVCIITGANTFSNFKVDAGRTQHFTAGTTTTASTWTLTGTFGNVITLTSVTAATHTLAKTGGGTVSGDYLDISYSIASPASTFYAGANSTDSLNNTNWTFSAAPLGSTAAITEEDDTLASNAGSITISSSLALTEEDDTLVATSAVKISSSLAATEADDTLSAASTVAISLSSAIIEEEDSLAGSAAVEITASLSATEENDALSTAGAVAIDSALAVTEEEDSLAGSAAVKIIASLSATEENDTLSAAASIGSVTLDSTLAASEEEDLLAGVAAVEITASLSATEENDALTAAGAGAIDSALAATEENDTLSAAASISSITYDSIVTITEEEDSLAGSAEVKITASLSVVDDDDTLSAQANITVVLSISATEEEDSLSGLSRGPGDGNTYFFSYDDLFTVIM